ncbi:MAG: MlaD family protein [Pseudomonadales bacterium]
MHNTRYKTVGLFILASLSICVVLVFWLVNYQGSQQSVRVISPIPVAGLVERSTVFYRGLRVGTVTKIQLNPTLPTEIWIDLDVSKDLEVTDAFYATLNLAGVTGSTNIELDVNEAKNNPVVATEIMLQRSFVDDIESEVAQLVTRIDKIAASFQPLAVQLQRETIPSLNRLIESLSETSQNFNDLIKDVEANPRELIFGRGKSPAEKKK